MSYRELLEFVSWNFRCTHVEGKTRLICQFHGEICWWDGRLADGELDMMREIGEHMDATGCGPATPPEPEIKAEDLRIEQFRTGGSVVGSTCAPNETSIKITHLPTGLVMTGAAREGESALALKSRMIERLRTDLAGLGVD